MLLKQHPAEHYFSLVNLFFISIAYFSLNKLTPSQEMFFEDTQSKLDDDLVMHCHFNVAMKSAYFFCAITETAMSIADILCSMTLHNRI